MAVLSQHAWLYYPTDSDCDVACVVMAHGFSLTRRDGLAPYAESLARAGVAVLVYAHRFVGDAPQEASSGILTASDVPRPG